MDFSNSRDIKKTKKDHFCFLCKQTIYASYPCINQSGKYDGRFFNDYSHHECMEKWCDYNHDQAYDEWNDLSECMDYEGESFAEWQAEILEKYPKIKDQNAKD